MKEISLKKNKLKSVGSITFHDCLLNNSLIAEVKTYRGEVKSSSTDRIRNKMSKLQDIYWNKSTLCEIFPNLTAEISSLRDMTQIEPKEGSAQDWIIATLKNSLLKSNYP